MVTVPAWLLFLIGMAFGIVLGVSVLTVMALRYNEKGKKEDKNARTKSKEV